MDPRPPGLYGDALDLPPVGSKSFPEGSFGPGPGRRSGAGCLWAGAYLLAILAGGLVLPAWGVYMIINDPDPVGPGGALFALSLLSAAGVAGAVGAVALVHLTVTVVRTVSRSLRG